MVYGTTMHHYHSYLMQTAYIEISLKLASLSYAMSQSVIGVKPTWKEKQPTESEEPQSTRGDAWNKQSPTRSIGVSRCPTPLAGPPSPRREPQGSTPAARKESRRLHRVTGVDPILIHLAGRNQRDSKKDSLNQRAGHSHSSALFIHDIVLQTDFFSGRCSKSCFVFCYLVVQYVTRFKTVSFRFRFCWGKNTS